MGKKEFTIEEKIEAIELHIHDGMGYGAISDRYLSDLDIKRYEVCNEFRSSSSIVKLQLSLYLFLGKCSDSIPRQSFSPPPFLDSRPCAKKIYKFFRISLDKRRRSCVRSCRSTIHVGQQGKKKVEGGGLIG